jgi:hypothetical protein
MSVIHQQIKPTPMQDRMLGIPENWNIALTGGRGGAKTFGVILMVERHLLKYGTGAKVLILRENYKGLQQIEQTMVTELHKAFPGKVKFNQQDHLLRIEGGGTVEFGQLEGPRDVNKYQGRETTLLIIDEAGLLREWRWVTLLKSNLRSPLGIPLRTVFTANPGGAQHAFLYKTFIASTRPWHPFEVDGETWVNCPSTLFDNPHLDQADYVKKLTAACGGDTELAKAWIYGDWSIKAGYFFGHVWEPKVHLLPRDLPFNITRAWYPRLAMDHGTSAPCITLFGGECPGDVRGIPAGSFVIFDEVSTADMSDPNLNSSLGWPLGKVAEEILEKCKEWHMHPGGVADDATGFLGQGDSLIETYRKEYGVYFQKPSKGRIQSLALINEHLSNAVLRNGKPGLYISERCEYLTATIPIIMRDAKRREDIDTAGPDHGVDALRYFTLSKPNVANVHYFNPY